MAALMLTYGTSSLFLTNSVRAANNGYIRFDSLNPSSGAGPFTATGGWDPQGNNCTPNFWIELHKNASASPGGLVGGNASTLLATLNPAPCDGGNHNHPGQNPPPGDLNWSIVFTPSEVLSNQYVCALLIHAQGQGRDTEGAVCYGQVINPSATPTPTATPTATPTEAPVATPSPTVNPCNVDHPCATDTPIATATPGEVLGSETTNDVCANMDGVQTGVPNGLHLDASGRNCVDFSQSGGGDNGGGNGGGQVLGASTTAGGGQVLGASTLGATGDGFGQYLAYITIILGGLLAVTSFYQFRVELFGNE